MRNHCEMSAIWVEEMVKLRHFQREKVLENKRCVNKRHFMSIC